MEVFPTLIDVQNLTFRYALSQTDSLRGVNLAVNEGDFCLIFGSSGSGKTTLLRHLKNELTPAGSRSGRVLYRGRELKELPPARSVCEIGLVMQNPESQIVTDVVWHELAFGLENIGMDSAVIRRRVAEMASFFGIGSWFHKKTAALSGGQKQLLNLVSVLAMQPRLLLLDEPTAQLDPIAAREFIDMVSRLNRETGLTVIMTEHRLEEALPVSTHAVLMENGRVKYSTEPRLLPAELIFGGDTRYLGSLPAAARIFAADFGAGESCPLTVREGKEHLAAVLNAKKPITYETNAKSGEKKQPMVECRELFFKYEKDAPDVLTGAELSANAEEILCLLGENGSGKSTLLQIIAGILRPQRGKVLIGQKNIRSFSPRALYTGNIGYLPQNPKAVFLHDTLRADLSDHAEEIAKTLGIEPLLDRHPYDLSGGEQQKAALARVLLQKPRILLLDEPTKGLDAQAKMELARLILQLRAGGACVIISTHDIDFAAENADRCALLFDGGVASEDTARAFFCGNYFYTTAANRIARDIAPGAITCEDVVKLCKN